MKEKISLSYWSSFWGALYYANLIIYAAFEKSLKEVSKLNRTDKQVNLIIYGEDQNGKDIFISHLKDHLKQVGISAEILGTKENNEIENVSQKKPNLRLFLSKKGSNDTFREHFEVDFLDISEQSSYYLSVFEILKKLLPTTNLGKIIANFKEQYEGLHGFFELKFPINSEAATRKKKIPHKAITLLKNKKGFFLIVIFLVGIVYFIIHKLIWRQEMWFTQEKKQVQVQNLKQYPIRSTFVMPAKSSFLDRPELIGDIHHKFEKQQDIPIIALVGPGGSGKTTLARQYGSQQTAPIIWEINAEATESLNSSFEALAVALAKAWNNQKVLEDIQVIPDLVEREIKLLQFVQERLKSCSDWLLIYDNVENFATIKKYFPYDVNNWGKGRVLITTRDNHIKNSCSVSQTLQVGELTPQESLTLFTKIMSHEKSFQFDPHQIDKTMEFLSKLPPFPLDISIAAYYLKSVNISYDKYLERLKESSKDFILIQKI